MSIKLDWDVTNAPTDYDVAPRKTIVDQPVRAPSQPLVTWPTAFQRPRLVSRGFWRWWWLAGAALLATLAGVGLWSLTQAGWQKVAGDVVAAVNYEDQEARDGATSLLLNVQDHGNADWLGVRQDEGLARQPAPLPVPMLYLSQTAASVTSVAPLDADYVLANVNRQFTTPDGQTLLFTLPQFYRRGSSNDWLRTAPPGSFWGNWLDWQGTQLVIRYSERDAAFVNQMGPVLDERLRAACATWAGGCAAQTPARLYLSGFVGSLEYNPIANTEVSIDLGTSGGGAVMPAEYFLSIPSPQIAGIPTDEAGRGYLADYLTVRLIASLARHISGAPRGSFQQMAQAIGALGLTRGDPGYLVSGQRQRFAPFGDGGQPFAQGGQQFAQGSNFLGRGPDRQTWRVVYYTTVAGDTLPSIAARFSTSVTAIERTNRLGNPDLLAAGVKLTIPLFAPGPTSAP